MWREGARCIAVRCRAARQAQEPRLQGSGTACVSATARMTCRAATPPRMAATTELYPRNKHTPSTPFPFLPPSPPHQLGERGALGQREFLLNQVPYTPGVSRNNLHHPCKAAGCMHRQMGYFSWQYNTARRCLSVPLWRESQVGKQGSTAGSRLDQAHGSAPVNCASQRSGRCWHIRTSRTRIVRFQVAGVLRQNASPPGQPAARQQESRQ